MARRGAPPAYETHHVLAALYAVQDESRIGRKELARRLLIGEGTCRGVVEVLRGRGLVSVSKSGITLSRKGKYLIDSLPFAQAQVELIALGLSDYAYAIAMRDHARFVRTGIEQRDDAVKAGAVGATSLVCEKGRLHFPDHTPLAGQFEEDEALLIAGFRPMEGDLIIIGYGRTEESARLGAFAAAVGVIYTPILSEETCAKD
ncbi:MAG: DUF4443 domain-containing protein [Euryarchaeota archaeon]|nr:DUF4443 domain-containing protein [Euryarchaeota archaeon]